MSDATKTLAYRYRLKLTPAQEDVLDSSQEQLRLVWNHLVRSQRFAIRQWENGRAASIENELHELSQAKESRGPIASARKLAEELKISVEEARQRKRQQYVEKVSSIPRSKKTGARLLLIARRRLATAYADAVVNDKVDFYCSLRAGVFNQLRKKFKECSENWFNRAAKTFRQPRFKRKGDSVALQNKPFHGCFKLKQISDLSPFGPKGSGAQALKKCKVIIHRDLPDSAIIQQVAITGKRDARYLVLMIKAIASEVAKDFPVTNRTAGIDAGIKVALTAVPLDSPDFGASDKIEKRPELAELSRDKRFLKRLRRLQRKLDRQRRANNPDCYDERHRAIKGKRPTIVRNNMRRTQTKITGMHLHLAESRRDFYHRAANEILNDFDNVAVGKWRPSQTRQQKPKTPSPKGLGAARRAINRITYDHAISLFISFLKDKAARSTNPKRVDDVCEAYTTRTCPKCGKLTGPSGKDDLSERKWTCSECGTTFLRDAASAWMIAKKFSMTAAASTVESSESKDSAQKAKGQREARKRDEGKIPVADQAVEQTARASAVLPQKPSVASGKVQGQASGDARASQLPVTRDASASRAVDIPPAPCEDRPRS